METAAANGFSIRTITAGLTLESADDFAHIEDASNFLVGAQSVFEESGFTVQSTRIATQPLAALCQTAGQVQALAWLTRLDRFVTDRQLLISVGSLLAEGGNDADFPTWAADLVAATSATYFSIAVADQESSVSPRLVRAAAQTIRSISTVGTNGEANFRFGAAARVPASTPFFPVAHHSGPPAFAIGLESAGLVAEAFRRGTALTEANTALRTLLEERLLPVQKLAESVAEATGRRYMGIDLSPAPSVDVSIAEPIEALTRRPFGSLSTLAACAAITEGLQSTQLKSCGYSGLMLPLLEDRVLARRAAEHRFGVQDLLLYSSVCGTGLDVIPLPGDCPEDDMEAMILDMAVLATRLQKPLAARLLPIPGKVAGDQVEFANPHLTTAAVLPPG